MFVFQFILSFNRHKQNHSKVSNYFMLFEVKTRKKKSVFGIKKLVTIRGNYFLAYTRLSSMYISSTKQKGYLNKIGSHVNSLFVLIFLL